MALRERVIAAQVRQVKCLLVAMKGHTGQEPALLLHPLLLMHPMCMMVVGKWESCGAAQWKCGSCQDAAELEYLEISHILLC